jgi:hypothetical protein
MQSTDLLSVPTRMFYAIAFAQRFINLKIPRRRNSACAAVNQRGRWPQAGIDVATCHVSLIPASVRAFRSLTNIGVK